MKLRLLTLFLILSAVSSSFAQKKKMIELNYFDQTLVRYGYYLGIHYKGYELKASEGVTLEQGAGFQLGVLADMNLSKYISLIAEPGIVSTTNKLIIQNDGVEEEFQIPTTHFHLPISLKFNTKRINNVRAFLMTGISYNYNFNAEKNKGDGNGKNDFLLTRHNFMAEAGIGVNFYLSYFKFTPSIRAVYGLNNEFESGGSNISSQINSLKSRGVFLNLIFQ